MSIQINSWYYVMKKIEVLDKIKIFLSSSMDPGKQLERRQAIIYYFDNEELFICFAFEKQAAPENRESFYLNNIPLCDLILLILDNKIIKDGVKKEIDLGKNENKKFLILIEQNSDTESIKNILNEKSFSEETVYKTFKDTNDLITIIDNSLKSHMSQKYKEYLNNLRKIKENNISNIIKTENEINEIKVIESSIISDFNQAEVIINKDINWPNNQKKYFFDPSKNKILQIQEIIKVWKNQRKTFPNWLIIPTDIRKSFWRDTEQFIFAFSNELKEPLDIEFIYELNWRLEKSLCPIYNDIIEDYELVINKYNPFPDEITIESVIILPNKIDYKEFSWDEIKQKWLELNLSLMRYYREENYHDKWNIIYDRLNKIIKYLSPELKLNFYYEQCLNALFSLNISEFKSILMNWKSDKNFLFMETKRAMLLAELGKIDEAEKILEESLNNIRVQLNLNPIKDNYFLISQESYIMMHLQHVKDAKSWIKQIYNKKDIDADIEKIQALYKEKWEKEQNFKNIDNIENQPNNKIAKEKRFESEWENFIKKKNDKKSKEYIEWGSYNNKIIFKEDEERRQKFKERWDVLKQYKCDPWNELNNFENILEREPAEIQKDIIVKPKFDIGEFTRSHRYGSIDTEILLSYNFLRFFEEIGIPFRIPGAVFYVKTVEGAIKRLLKYSPNWALTTLLRTGEPEFIDAIFNRENISKINIKEIDEIINNYLKVLQDVKTDIEIENNLNYNKINLGLTLADIMPEIFSRLCVKCSNDLKNKLLIFLIEVLNSRYKSRYSGIPNLIKRLINSCNIENKYKKIPELLKIPVLNNAFENREHKDPFYYISLNIKDINKIDKIKIDNNIIEELLIKVKSNNKEERNNSIYRLIALYNVKLLNKKQIDKFALALWSQIDKDYKLPNNTDFYKFYLITLPHPDNINPIDLFKTYIKNEKFPIQKKQNNEGISISGKNIILCTEILGSAKNLFTLSGIDWTQEELLNLFNRLLDWWNNDKDYLKNKDEEIKKEFIRRFSNIEMILGSVIIPNLLMDKNDSLKKQINDFNNDLEIYGISNLYSKTANIIYFPEKKEEIFTEIEKSILLLEESEIINGFNGFVKLIELYSLSKIAKIPDCIWDLISQQIKWRRMPALKHALKVTDDIIKNTPEIIPENFLNNILFGLKYLKDGTRLDSQKSFIDLNRRLECRESSASLAYNLYNYYNKNKLEIPEIISDWKEICSSEEEFAEIRNKWLD